MSGDIQVEPRADGVATVWIDNPAHRNALNDGLIDKLIEAFTGLGEDRSCRVIVLRGRNGTFCAGRELNDLRRLQDSDMATITATYERLRRLNEAVYYCPHPTIAAIERFAFGAGITVVSWCDIALADSEVLLAYPEVHHGIPPSPAMMALLRGISRKAAMELVLTGRRLKADEAAQLGLITRSFAPGRLDEELEAVIKGILRGSPAAIKRTKEFVWHCEDISNRAGMISAVDSISIGITSDEAREGIGAFLEKRTPKWA